jgi:cell migration-inducing and hyaluronan-binding protein
MADNGIGFTHASGSSGRSAYTSRMVDSLFVGETDNIGNPTTPAEKATGRSLPFPNVRISRSAPTSSTTTVTN